MCTNPMFQFYNDDIMYRSFTAFNIMYGSDGDPICGTDRSGTLLRVRTISCGKCIECRIRYSKDWAQRIMLEAKCYERNYFLTLTYNDENLPIGNRGLPTCRIADASAFIKRMRRFFEYRGIESNVRYFASSEYGDTTGRPHIHICLLNCPVDLCGEVVSRGTFPTYGNNEILSKLWTFGFAVFQPLTYESACYVARYVVKKLNGEPAEKYAKLGVEPEKAVMSRRPGIGSNVLTTLGVSDKIYLPNGLTDQYCRFYMRKLKELEEDMYNVVKSERERVQVIRRMSRHKCESAFEERQRRSESLKSRYKKRGKL